MIDVAQYLGPGIPEVLECGVEVDRIVVMRDHDRFVAAGPTGAVALQEGRQTVWMAEDLLFVGTLVSPNECETGRQVGEHPKPFLDPPSLDARFPEDGRVRSGSNAGEVRAFTWEGLERARLSPPHETDPALPSGASKGHLQRLAKALIVARFGSIGTWASRGSEPSVQRPIGRLK